MNIEKPSFTGNVKKVEFLEKKRIIYYQLPVYDNRDTEGNYINDRNGSFSFYDFYIPRCSKTIIAVFRDSFAGYYDFFGDTKYPEDDVIGIYRHEGFSVK